jgi:hypothetical protein
MASISIAINRGDDGFKISSFTLGTQAPSTGDIQLCFNVQDTNSKNLTRKDVVLALEAFERAIKSGSLLTPVTVGGANPWIGTPIL